MRDGAMERAAAARATAVPNGAAPLSAPKLELAGTRFSLLTYVGDGTRQMLERATPLHMRWAEQRGFESLRSSLESDRWGAVIVDPQLLTVAELGWLASRAHVTERGLLLLGQCAPRTVFGVLQAATNTPTRVIFTEAAGPTPGLDRQLWLLRVPSVRASLLTALAPRLATLPLELQLQTVGLFGIAKDPPSLDDMAERSGCSRRGIDRHMFRLGFRGGRRLIAGVGMARAWELGQVRRSQSRVSVARASGHTCDRQLRDQITAAFGMPYERFEKLVLPEMITDRLVKWMTGKA